MRTELLDIPGRRETNLAELVTFFAERDDTGEMLTDFVTTFAGMTIQVPGPEVLREVHRDELILAELRRDQSAEKRIELMRQHSIPYAHLQAIWGACEERGLEPPATRTEGGAIAQAAAWINRFPPYVNDIVAMYSLNARDRSKATEMAGLQMRSDERLSREAAEIGLTQPQLHVLTVLLKKDDPQRPDELAGSGRSPTQTLRVLEARGLVRKTKRGYLPTAKARRLGKGRK